MLVESFSGIRGLYKTDLKKDLIVGYALSFSNFLKEKTEKPTIVIGMDTRPSSKQIKDEMISVFVSQSIDVIDVGLNTTPAVQLGIRLYKADGGVIITASHNEPEWNGFKFLSEKGSMLKPEDVEEVIKDRKLIKAKESKVKGALVDKEKELQRAYIDFILDIIGKEGIRSITKAGLKLVVDPNGGTAATVIRGILEKAGVEVIGKNIELGVFNRLIEPNEKSLAYLAFYAKDLDADLGAGWDCDGDRVEIVLPDGRMLSGQYVLALVVDEVLSGYKGKNKVVVINDATSNLIYEVAEKYNTNVVETEVGEINVVEKMDELNAPVGGEGSSSGGIIPPSRCRDGILCLMLILRSMAKKRKKLSEILNSLPQYFNSRIDMRCEPGKAAGLRRRLENYWKNQKYIKEIRKTGDETGGLKIIREMTKEGPGWIWYRASKTEAGVFRIITDTKSKLYADKLLAMGEKAFNDCLNEIK